MANDPELDRINEIFSAALSKTAEPIRTLSTYIAEGGKRLRPKLALAAGRQVGAPQDKALSVAAAAELIHTASIVLDDLPVFDNSETRHGRKTAHLAFPPHHCVLAALELLNQAQVILRETDATGRLLKKYNEALSRSIIGQMRDIDEPYSEAIARDKTGPLFGFSAWAPALLADKSEKEQSAMWQFGEMLGTAFQIMDDLKDKDRGQPDANRITELKQEALALLDPAFENKSELQQAADLIIPTNL